MYAACIFVLASSDKDCIAVSSERISSMYCKVGSFRVGASVMLGRTNDVRGRPISTAPHSSSGMTAPEILMLSYRDEQGRAHKRTWANLSNRSAITAECPNMQLQPCNTTTAGYGAPPLEGPPSSADKPESGRASFSAP
jgi:hypothetical protein